jgi:hypothetical protein
MKNFAMISSFAILAAAGSTFGQAASFSGSYFNDFDGLAQAGEEQISGQGPHAIQGVLGSTGMEGWFGANVGGTASNTQFRAHNGSLSGSAGRGIVFFGADGSSDRALGALSTSNQVNAFGLVLVNDTNDTFIGLDISFIGEQWRAGGADILNVLSFSYGMGSTLNDATTPFAGLDFFTPNLAGGEIAIDGNDPANQANLSDTITGLNWAPGQSIVLRWDAVDLPGQDNGLAIDNLSITGIVPTPGTIGLLGLAGLAAIRRRR